MLEAPQMRAPVKPSLALAGIVVAFAAVAWNLTHPYNNKKIEAVSKPAAEDAILGQPANSSSSNRAELIDSDNDGIPDVIELRSFQDRDSFRRWFTAIAETQFYQLSDQWSDDQRDCAGLARFAIREALRHHDRIWFQKMGSAYQT